MATEEIPTLGDKGERFDMLVVQGTDWGPFEFTLIDDQTGLPEDITGCTFLCEIRKEADAATAAASAVFSIVDGPNGVGTIAFLAASTGTVPADPDGEDDPDSIYVCDWRIKYPSGRIRQLTWGFAPVFRSVSRGAFV